jgi:hypothetical protein
VDLLYWPVISLSLMGNCAQAAKAAEITGKSLAQWTEEHLRAAALSDIKRAMPV